MTLKIFLAFFVSSFVGVSTIGVSQAQSHHEIGAKDQSELEPDSTAALDTAMQFLKIARSALEANEFDLAIESALDGISSIDGSGHSVATGDDPNLIAALHKIVIHAGFSIGDLTLQETHLRSVLELLGESFTLNSPEVQSWSRELAKVLFEQGSPDASLDILNELISSTPGSDDHLAAMFEIGDIYERLGQFDKAKKTFLETSSFADRIGNFTAENIATNYAAFAAVKSGHFEEAERLHIEVIQEVNAALSDREREYSIGLVNRELELLSTQQLARLRIDQGRYADVQRLLVTAYTTADIVFDSVAHHVPMSLYTTLMETTILEGDYEYAREDLDRRLSYIKPGHSIMTRDMARIYSLIGYSIAKSEKSTSDDLDQAIYLLQQAENVFADEEGYSGFFFLENRVFIAAALVRQGNSEEAVRLLRTFIELGDRGLLNFHLGFRPILAEAVSILGEFSEDPSDSFRLAKIMLDEWQLRRTSLDLNARNYSYVVRDNSVKWVPGVVLNSAWQARQAGAEYGAQLLDTAFVAIQEASFDTTTFSIAQGISRREAEKHSQDAGSLIKQREIFLAEYRLLSENIYERSGASYMPFAEREGREQEQRLSEIDSRLIDLDEQILDIAPNYLSSAKLERYGLDEISEIMHADEAVVILFPTDRGTHVICLTDDISEVVWIRSELGEEMIGKYVENLMMSLDLGRHRSSSAANDIRYTNESFDRQSAYALYSALLKPVEERLAEKKKVFFLTHGDLSNLPLSVLVTSPPTGDDSDPNILANKTSWLVDKEYASVQLPSISSFVKMSAINRRPFIQGGARTLVGFADPVLKERHDERPNDGVREFPDLSSLPSLAGTRHFLSNIAAQFDVREDSILVGHEATESNLYRHPDLSDAKVIVFATHGLVENELSGLTEPALVLTPGADLSDPSNDGLLTASEIAGLRLNADWIILAACNTAAGETKKSAGLTGLARSFFQAGSTSVLASYWTVSEKSTTLLLTKTLGYFSEGIDSSRALQMAMQDIRRSGPSEGVSALAHPAMWAPFMLIEAN